jgi:hypothetical protein
MSVRNQFLAMAGLGLVSVSFLAAAAPPPAPHEDAATRQTKTDLRTVGTAMWNWYKDQMAAKPKADHVKAEEESKSVDFAAVPVISRGELAKVLVPKYIAAIPEKDGWGHPYEFRLSTRDLNATRIMAARSPGKDGKFSGTVYEIAAFPPADQDQDIVWIDGYFARWPQGPKKSK